MILCYRLIVLIQLYINLLITIIEWVKHNIKLMCTIGFLLYICTETQQYFKLHIWCKYFTFFTKTLSNRQNPFINNIAKIYNIVLQNLQIILSFHDTIHNFI